MERRTNPHSLSSRARAAAAAASCPFSSPRRHLDARSDGAPQASYQKKATQYDNIRVGRIEREEARWKSIEEKKLEEERYWDQQRESGAKALKNNSCVPYDAITLRYNDGIDGDRLRYDDEKVRYRAALRSQNLMRCGDTRTGYDIVSGHSRPNVEVPGQPEPSDSLAEHMEQEAIKAEEEDGYGPPPPYYGDSYHDDIGA